MESRAVETAISGTSYDAVKSAIEAVNLIGPRTYRITGLNPGPIRFMVFGCQGTGDGAQAQKAELMGTFKDVPLIFGAGDNGYKNGMDTPYHPDFDTKYHNIYPKEKKGTMAFGNHDWVRQIAINVWIARYYKWLPEGEKAGINQAAHTFYHELEDVFLQRFTLFQQEEIPWDALGHWNMPYYFFSYILENESAKAQVIILNTCTILDDYLDFAEGKVDANGFEERKGDDGTVSKKPNQIAWLLSTYKEAALNGRQVFILQHNPLKNHSKRDFQAAYDTDQYLGYDEGAEIKSYHPDGSPVAAPTDAPKEKSRKIRIANLLRNKKITLVENDQLKEKIIRLESESMHELIDAMFQDLKIEPACFLVAHQHFLSWYNNAQDQYKDHPIRQFTAGGGSHDLHNRAAYRDHPYVGFQAKETGFGIVNCDANSFFIDVHTIHGHHLRFDPKSHAPIVQKHWDNAVMKLREVILGAVDRYFNSLKEHELQLRARLDKPMVLQSPYTLFGIVSDYASYGYATLREKAKNPYHDKNEKEFQVVQDIQTFFNQHKLPKFEACKLKLAELAANLLQANPASPFYDVLQKAVSEHYQKPLTELLAVKVLKEDASNTRKLAVVKK